MIVLLHKDPMCSLHLLPLLHLLHRCRPPLPFLPPASPIQRSVCGWQIRGVCNWGSCIDNTILVLLVVLLPSICLCHHPLAGG